MLQLVRIDDRLIHGQVLIGWGRVLHFTKIILPVEDVGHEEWEQELLKSAVPDDIEVQFTNLSSLVEFAPDIVEDSTKTIIILGSIRSAHILAKEKFIHKQFNVGGIHYKPEREEILPYVFLSQEEKELARQILEMGYELIAQDLPENKQYDLRGILQ